MPRQRPAVVFIDTGTMWQPVAVLAAALRRRGFDTHRVTAPPISRNQQIMSLAYRAACTHTETTIRWAGNTAPVDISRVRAAWLPNVVDIQTEDPVSAALLDYPQWKATPDLHRVPDSVPEARLYDKLAQVEDATRVGVPVPDTYTDPKQISGEKVVIKQRIGSGGNGVVLVPVSEVAKWQERWRSDGGGLIFQEYIEGEELAVSGFAQNGEMKAVGAYVMSKAPGAPLGPPVRIRMLDRPELIDAAGRYMKEMQYTGVFNIQFMVADQNYMIDVNTRFFGSWTAMQSAGVPILESYLDHLANRPISPRQREISYDTPIWGKLARNGSTMSTAKTCMQTMKRVRGIGGARAVAASTPALAEALRPKPN